MDELSQVLRLIMLKLGIRSNNLPSQEEKMVLLEHICTKFASHTVEEIKLAFDMAMIGKLDGDFKCYENFSCDYFSHVMKAYRKWAKEEYKQIPQPPPEIEQKEDISDSAKGEWLADVVLRVKTGKITLETIEFMPPMLFEYLEKKGEITTPIEKNYAYLQKAVVYRAGELQKQAEKRNSIDAYRELHEFRAMKEQGYFTGNEIERVKALAKKLLFFDYVLKNY